MMPKKLKPKKKIKIHNIKTALEVLNSIKAEVGFTDEEILIIIFTSVDQDYLNHLIVMQGEFLKWFNLDFEGEN